MRVRVYGEDSTARCCVLEEKVQRDTKRVRRRRKDRRKEEESLIERERERETGACVTTHVEGESLIHVRRDTKKRIIAGRQLIACT